jgi:acylphosphatase
LGLDPRRRSRSTPGARTRGADSGPSTFAASHGVVRAHSWISGRVQGVGFRVFVLEQARRLGVSGFVRNLSDRRVEMIAEGAKESVEALLDAVRRGPAGARVTDTDVQWETPSGENGFSIRDDARA